MFKIVRNIIFTIQKIIICITPYNGFKNRKLFKSYSGFEKEFYKEYWDKAVNNISASISDVGYGYRKIEKNNKATYVNNYKVMLDDHVTLNLVGNKPFVLRVLQDQGFPVPKFLEYEIQDVDKAFKFLEDLGGNAVVKPASGTGAGRGVTTKINTSKKLSKASSLAASFCNKIVIEEQIAGDSFRLLYINGEFTDAIRRDPPVVVGDGISTIKQLIKNENTKRINSDRILTFHPLIIDLECKLKLKEQGLSTNSVPDKDVAIIVKTVVNQNSCFENHVVRDDVDPSLILMGKKIVTQLGIKLGGIDVIAKDITIPLEKSNGVINEINTTPGLHHHVLVAEKDKILPIGESVLKYIFSQ
ncbi:MAG: cyanophycin synthetase [Thiohalomonadales bacterium]